MRSARGSVSLRLRLWILLTASLVACLVVLVFDSHYFVAGGIRGAEVVAVQRNGSFSTDLWHRVSPVHEMTRWGSTTYPQWMQNARAAGDLTALSEYRQLKWAGYLLFFASLVAPIASFTAFFWGSRHRFATPFFGAAVAAAALLWFWVIMLGICSTPADSTPAGRLLDWEVKQHGPTLTSFVTAAALAVAIAVAARGWLDLARAPRRDSVASD